jgi:DNA-directed RNA polymerase specialized sigma24 family protein
VDETDAQGLVRDFLATLEPDKRSVFELVDLAELPAPDVARILGIEPEKVHARLRTARRRFDAFVEMHRAPRMLRKEPG